MKFNKQMLLVFMVLIGANMGAMQQGYTYSDIRREGMGMITATRSDGATVSLFRNPDNTYWGDITMPAPEESFDVTMGDRPQIPRSSNWIGLSADDAQALYQQLTAEVAIDMNIE